MSSASDNFVGESGHGDFAQQLAEYRDRAEELMPLLCRHCYFWLVACPAGELRRRVAEVHVDWELALLD
ncbi:MAG: hypothetical protein MJE77_46710 [Proteobacteria bacterium]|nr:hypothetical protein [Pseudomonadota bacterium]